MSGDDVPFYVGQLVAIDCRQYAWQLGVILDIEDEAAPTDYEANKTYTASGNYGVYMSPYYDDVLYYRIEGDEQLKGCTVLGSKKKEPLRLLTKDIKSY